MILKPVIKLFVVCPSCHEGDWRVDHLPKGQSTKWACDECGKYFCLERVSEDQFSFEEIDEKKTPVTVTLRSDTVPPITMILNTWKFGHSQKHGPEEYRHNEQYFYDEHTCPTNWLRDVEEIVFEGDRDPHGVFKFVDVVDGHFDHHADEAFKAGTSN